MFCDKTEVIAERTLLFLSLLSELELVVWLRMHFLLRHIVMLLENKYNYIFNSESFFG